MINLDMVGRLREDRVTVFGTRSSPPFDAIVGAGAKQLGLQTNQPDGVGPSDHLSFYNKQIPVLHFFTGSHTDYHRPGDTWDKLNYAGMARIGDLVLGSALAIAALPESPGLRQPAGATAINCAAASGGLAAFIWESFPNTATVSMASCSQASRLTAQPRRQVYLKVM